MEIIPFKAVHAWDFPPQNGFTRAGMVAMAKRLEASGPGFTAMDNGRPLGAAGICLYWEGVGEAWTLLSPEIKQQRIWLTRTVKRVLNDLTKALALHRVQVTVRADQEINKCWARALGFSDPLPLPKYGPDGANFIMFTRIT